MAEESWAENALSVAYGLMKKLCPWATPEYVNEQCVHVIEANSDLRHDVDELTVLMNKMHDNVHDVRDTIIALETRLTALEKLVTCQDEMKTISMPAFASVLAATLYKDAARNFFNKNDTTE
jgi:hypothetical protein